MSDDNARIARLTQPLVPRMSAPEHTFHLGLVLSGTVSAGAWTAGVLDFLFEALDTWEAAKAAGRPVPDHSVRIDIFGGASGGGVNAALVARAATCRFPHVRRAADATAANPFWQIWVEALDIAGMLRTTDLAGTDAVLASLLDGSVIDEAVRGLLAWRPGVAGVSALSSPRAWLADPFRVMMTLTNLRGVPYRMPMAAGEAGLQRATFRLDHADHVIFAAPTTAEGAAASLRGDEFLLPLMRDAASDWHRLGEYAKATGAFPVGFPPRRLSRPTAHYGWRAVLLPPEIRNGTLVKLPAAKLRSPAWNVFGLEADGAEYAFDCVDGGAVDVQPIELVRAALAGLGQSLPRSGQDADSAVLLIEPLAAEPKDPFATERLGVLEATAQLIQSTVAQSRFATASLVLALDQEVYSRYLMTAGRTSAAGEKRWGQAALATGGLDGFLGFLRREWRAHDFLLGRRNACDYLRHHFTVPVDNPRVARFAATEDGAEFRGRTRNGRPHQQIIPIMAEAMPPPGDVPWPGALGTPLGFDEAVRGRLEAVAEGLLAKAGVGGLLAGLGAPLIAGRAARHLLAKLRDQLEKPSL